MISTTDPIDAELRKLADSPEIVTSMSNPTKKYTLTYMNGRIHCDCPSFVFYKAKLPDMPENECKHGQAYRAGIEYKLSMAA